MEPSEKPFACFEEGCGMRFTNEGHLSVHRKKHEMSLNFGDDGNPKSFPFLDQTPTPTRFIRNCEEVGLFQDLQNINPFDEQFRKAVQSDPATISNESNNLSVPLNEDQDALNTPSVFPTNFAHEESIISSVSVQGKEEEKVSDAKTTSSIDITNVPSISVSQAKAPKSPKLDTEADDVIPLALVAPSSHSKDVSTPKPVVRSRRVVKKSTTKLIKSTKNVVIKNKSFVGSVQMPIAKPTPVLVSPPSIISSTLLVPPVVLHIPENFTSAHQITHQESVIKSVHGTVNEIQTSQNSTEIKIEPKTTEEVDPCVKNVILPRAVSVNNPVTQTNAATVIHDLPAVENQVTNKALNLQVLIKLPDGSTIPLQLPSVPATTVASRVPQPIVSPETTLPEHTSAKQKLKEVLVKSVMKCAPSSEQNNGVVNDQNAEIIPLANDATLYNSGNSHSPSNSRIRRNSSGNEDPGEKRQELLERNRAAAIRCRLKRKFQIDSLEGKAEQLQQTNSQLQKLKEVLVKSVMKRVPSSEQNDEVVNDQNAEIIPLANDATLSDSGNSQSSSNSRIRRNSSGNEDPGEKRQKFLERNRAAAIRCRLKRKFWIDSLEGKAEQLQQTNSQLQKEVALLRKEVSYLKTMLLAHKDCPVTLQQIQQNQERSP